MENANPYDPPHAAEAGVEPGSSQWGLVPTIVFGAFAALMAMLPLAVVAGFVFWYTRCRITSRPRLVLNATTHLNAPYVKLVVVLIWVVGMVVGGFVVRRCAGKWLVASIGVASFYLVIWGIPSIVLAAGKFCYTVDHHRSTSSGSDVGGLLPNKGSPNGP